MPVIPVNGIRLAYRDVGDGPPVVLIMGAGATGSAWHLHQVPALVAAGHRAITFDNRGIQPDGLNGPKDPDDPAARGFTVHDLVADVAGLITQLDLAPSAVVGTSLGARVAAELALTRPDLVGALVLMAARGRSDPLHTALSLAERELDDREIELPPRYRAVVKALTELSPRGFADEQALTDWLEVFELAPPPGPAVCAQRRLYPMPDRLDAYRRIDAPCHVIAFADDVMAPPAVGREVAAAVPGASFEVIEGCGHLGYLERPEAVNRALLEFLRASVPAGTDRSPRKENRR
ncbi:alpha/beta fold hydrolase [Streptomyces malaysiensis subsp. malaysiensis]|uniref:Alpha/beta hydrolase n=1 Tax=Streptomyces malaysiensis TaxID=92644 RepID=A0ABX6WE63_STRMQ|nr:MULTISPECIES: alpha/beta hydrolase [Streptomyces]MCQ6247301.1 alpha/beta hydrolase [Streptomyces malaysiensis]QDL69638.1 alpha/beta hydrolase [Streptomyces malaysiensis]QPI59733.1 alpha/beta hydrolase [Streptomyces solisilvae]UHH21403.1 alpha/beta hydrolase [Streptomyces sp. HNM0561]